MKRRGVVPLALSAALVVAAWIVAGRPPIGQRPDPSRVGLTELGGVADLRARFNADAGTARLVLILSPT